jgi:hypothetical protein
VIAVSQRLSCASTSAHEPESSESGRFDAASEQLSALATAWGATVKTVAGTAASAAATAHLADTDRVMVREYVSPATRPTANRP